MESTQSQTFNPFRIFDREVERRFTIRPRDYKKYTEERLHERVAFQLRTFMIANTLYFLLKDVCSFLGITPNNTSRSIESIDSCHVRKECIQLDNMSDCNSDKKDQVRVCQRRNVYLINEPGIYALIQKSRTVYAREFKQWLHEEVLPAIAKYGAYISDNVVQKIQNDSNELKKLLDDLEKHKQDARKKMQENEALLNKCQYGYLYIASSEEYMNRDIYKIGSTIDIDNRLVKLNTSRDIDDSLTMLKTYYVLSYKRIERMVHCIFDKYRNSDRREFFTIPYYDLVTKLDELLNEDE